MYWLGWQPGVRETKDLQVLNSCRTQDGVLNKTEHHQLRWKLALQGGQRRPSPLVSNTPLSFLLGTVLMPADFLQRLWAVYWLSTRRPSCFVLPAAPKLTTLWKLSESYTPTLPQKRGFWHGRGKSKDIYWTTTFKVQSEYDRLSPHPPYLVLSLSPSWCYQRPLSSWQLPLSSAAVRSPDQTCLTSGRASPLLLLSLLAQVDTGRDVKKVRALELAPLAAGNPSAHRRWDSREGKTM